MSGVLGGQADRTIIAGILLMAQRMGIVVVAECIETLAQGAALMAMGCMFGQGYAIARPMPTHEVITWVAGYERTPLWGQNRKN